MKMSSYRNLQVPNFSIHALREILEEADLDWRAALHNVEISLESVNRRGGTIPARKELAFQLEFVALTQNRPDLWVRAGRAYSLGTLGVRGLVLATAPTITAYLEASRDSDYAPVLVDTTILRTPDGTVTGVEYTHSDAPEELIPFSVYRELCFTARTLTWLYGQSFPFTFVRFPLPEASPDLAAYVPCTIYCGCETLQLWWDPSISNKRLPFGDAFQHEAWIKADTEILEGLRKTGDWPDTVAKIIKASPGRNRKLANAAASLQVSPRTLQRKLEIAGHDFAQVRDKTLGDLAADMLLNTNQPVSRIARGLGYVDPASFTFAFKRWRGMPPSVFREAGQYQDEGKSRGK